MKERPGLSLGQMRQRQCGDARTNERLSAKPNQANTAASPGVDPVISTELAGMRQVNFLFLPAHSYFTLLEFFSSQYTQLTTVHLCNYT